MDWLSFIYTESYFNCSFSLSFYKLPDSMVEIIKTCSFQPKKNRKRLLHSFRRTNSLLSFFYADLLSAGGSCMILTDSIRWHAVTPSVGKHLPCWIHTGLKILSWILSFANVNTELSIAGSTFCSAGLTTINKALADCFKVLKAIVMAKLEILSSFTHPHVVLNLHSFQKAWGCVNLNFR